MNKDKYLKELEKRLKYLNSEQKSNEIFRISNELDNGGIVKDISQEIEDIYKKYKINPLKKEKNANNKILNKFDKIGKSFENFYNSFIKYDSKNKIIIVRDLIIIILLVSIFKIPFLVLENVLFSFFHNMLSVKIINLFNNLVEILYVIFAIITFIKMFKRRFKKELKIDWF